jgi:hypothetical protein
MRRGESRVERSEASEKSEGGKQGASNRDKGGERGSERATSVVGIASERCGHARRTKKKRVEANEKRETRGGKCGAQEARDRARECRCADGNALRA